MFVHIGGEVIIPIEDIIAIIDLEAKQNSLSTQEFLSVAEDEGFVVNIKDRANSFVVTTKKVYLSPISTVTLRKRVSDFLA